MKKIFIRSPYFVKVDEDAQTTGKIELYIWNKSEDKPSTPTYTLSKNVPSLNQNELSWNISNYAKEFIKPIFPNTVSVPTEENSDTWCFMQVISYSNDVEVNDETFVCLNGYTSYSGGYNQYNSNVVVPLVNSAITFQKSASVVPYVNVFYEQGEYEIIGVGTLSVGEPTMYKLPLTADLNGDDYYEYYSTELCEPKYTPITCTYVNRYGGWQFLTFFKASMGSIETDYKEFNMLPSSVDYNVLQGQKQRFNHQGKHSIKCNTGWVDENYFELIQDLLLSDVVLLDNKPVVVKSKSSEKKTHLNVKNINYEIEFEYNYGLINDVI
jgi:hypothetical protein